MSARSPRSCSFLRPTTHDNGPHAAAGVGGTLQRALDHRATDPFVLFFAQPLDKSLACARLVEVIFSQERRPNGAFFISNRFTHRRNPNKQLPLFIPKTELSATRCF
jgi:hypothetical protein